MSIKMMAIAWGIPYPPSTKLVLLAIADNADDAGFCWPSQETIKEKTQLSVRTIRDCIRKLEDDGVLLTKARINDDGLKRGLYYHLFPSGEICRTAAHSANSAGPHSANGSKPFGNGCRMITRDEPSLEPSLDNNPPISPQAGSPSDLPPWLPDQPWKAFVEMRKKIKRPLTARALSLLLNDLSKLRDEGHDPGAVLDQSTVNCWRGVFPISNKERGYGKKPESKPAADYRAGNLPFFDDPRFEGN